MSGEAPTLDSRPVAARYVRKYLQGEPLDAIFTVLAVAMFTGLTLDFKVHREGVSFVEEGFFTTSHIVFYAGFLLIAVTLSAVVLVNRRRVDGWIRAIPPGYRIGFLGVVLFALAGVGDFFWHSAFGFEQGIEAITSPTHLVIALSSVLFFSCPLRAAWIRDGQPTGFDQLPVVLSAGLVLNNITFYSLYGSPLSQPLAISPDRWPGYGLLVIVASSALLAGMAVVLLNRFALGAGAFTLMFGLVGITVTYVNATVIFIPVMLVTGLVADIFVGGLSVRTDDPWRFRSFAAAVPLVFAASYFAIIEYNWGITWEIHVWAGAIVSAALVGLLISYVAVPYCRADG